MKLRFKFDLIDTMLLLLCNRHRIFIADSFISYTFLTFYTAIHYRQWIYFSVNCEKEWERATIPVWRCLLRFHISKIGAMLVMIILLIDTSSKCWIFTGVLVTANFLRSLGLFEAFEPILLVLSSGWFKSLFLQFSIHGASFPGSLKLLQGPQLQLVSVSPIRSTSFSTL